MKKHLFIILLAIIIAISGCSSSSLTEKSIKLETKMIERLIGEGDTEGWGSDLGVSFIHKGKMYFLGGDTNTKDAFAPNIIGVTDDLNPSDGLKITWKKDKNGNPKEFFSIIEPSSTVPAGAISISDKIYVFMMDVINWDYPATARAVLIKSEDDGRTFHTVWEGRKDNKFVNISPVISNHPTKKGKDALYLVGSGKYRESPIYLAVTEIDTIENKASYLYFAGFENGSPIWKTSENDALPIVDKVKVGELSVQWNGYLGKWLLSYFDYSNGNQGNLYFRTATNIWGPWSNPVFVFSGTKHYDWYKEVITRQGPQSWGVPYGSYLLPETNNSNSSKVYFTLSLWVPYSIFLMEVDLSVLDRSSKIKLSFLKTQGKDIVNESGEKVFLKGVNFGCWLLWEGGALELPNNPEHQLRKEMEKKISKEKVDNFFNLILKNYITSDDFVIAKSMGLNFIRLPFHHRYAQENQLTKLDKVISWAKSNGIYIILDLQAAPGSQNTAYHSDSDGNAYLWSNTTYQKEFIDLWKTLAQRYKDESTIAGYELLNEPEAPENTQLISLYQKAIDNIRKIDKKHIIFLDGNNYAYDFSIFNPPLFGDNIVYVFHTYLSLEETQKKVQQYKAFQTNFQVPIMCNEYGGEDEIKLTSYFQKEEIPYSPWGYKLSFNTLDKTPFYYMPSNHIWRTKFLNKISELMKSNNEFRKMILTTINISNLSNQCKKDLINVLNEKGELPPNIFRIAIKKYPEETKELEKLSIKVMEITFNYTVDALVNILQTMSEKELTELMQSLQTQYWEKGIVHW